MSYRKRKESFVTDDTNVYFLTLPRIVTLIHRIGKNDNFQQNVYDNQTWNPFLAIS